MKKLIALLLVLVLAFGLIACDNTPDDPTGDPNPSGNVDPSDPKPTDPKPTDPKPTDEPEAKLYTWDVTVVYNGYDAKGGEVPPVVTITNKENAEHTLALDPIAALGAMEGDVIDFTPLLNEDNDLVLDGELTTTNVAFDEAEWTVSDNERGSIFSYEVVTELTEGDYDTHGELLIVAKAPDYVWDVTVIFEPGTEGTYEFTNPGLDGWEDEYRNQMFVVTPENNTFQVIAFNHSSWIVDNVPTWHQWVIFDVDDVCPEYKFEVTKKLTNGDRVTHGELVITIYLPN